MHTITLVTGNKGKLAEWQRMFPADFSLLAEDIDLDEIQSMDLEAIAVDKAKRAYAQLQRPVMVEDVSAGLDDLGGLPGPFIKYFEKALGLDALYKVGNPAGSPARAICTIAYYDGQKIVTARGEVLGTTCAPRGDGGFGFDKVFMPNGQPKTYAEMTPVEKDALSHRSLAIRDLVMKLQQAIA